MAYPLATPHWDKIEELAVQGVPVSVLAERFGVAEKTIYGRAAEEDWQTPGRVKAKLQHLQKLQAIQREKDPLFDPSAGEKISDSVLLETWETRAADLRNLSYSVAVQAIKESKGQIVIESASDLKHAVHVARQATGLLDTDAPQIQLSMFGNADLAGPAFMESQAIECEPIESVQENADFWE